MAAIMLREMHLNILEVNSSFFVFFYTIQTPKWKIEKPTIIQTVLEKSKGDVSLES